MISLVNAARLRAGRSSVGWIHPILYASYKEFTKDITSGNNSCVSGFYAPYTCCPQGFSAAPGWDPVTGLGVLNFKQFKTFMMNIGISSTTTVNQPSIAPTTANQPSIAPTNAKQPSFAPPTANQPSIAPTTANQPSNTPSIAPSNAPPGRSSSAPSIKSSMICLSLSILCVFAATELTFAFC